jgi:hypothetical protein
MYTDFPSLRLDALADVRSVGLEPNCCRTWVFHVKPQDKHGVLGASRDGEANSGRWGKAARRWLLRSIWSP